MVAVHSKAPTSNPSQPYLSSLRRNSVPRNCSATLGIIAWRIRASIWKTGSGRRMKYPPGCRLGTYFNFGPTMRIKHWLSSAIRWLIGFSERQIKSPVGGLKPSLPGRSPINVPRYRGVGDPPPLYWKACDPSTVMRFKAVLTCPRGHCLTLRVHTIEASGIVWPSVVCQFRECEFHDFVRLR